MWSGSVLNILDAMKLIMSATIGTCMMDHGKPNMPDVWLNWDTSGPSKILICSTVLRNTINLKWLHVKLK